MTTGEKIRRARITNEKRFSQIGLAVAAGVHEQTVKNWESGRSTPSEGNLFWVARALEVKEASLAGDEEGTG